MLGANTNAAMSENMQTQDVRCKGLVVVKTPLADFIFVTQYARLAGCN